MLELPNCRTLLAFSGGPDSVGLAARLRGADIVLGYADHRLRGAADVRRERASVVAAARALGVPLVRTRLRCGPGEAGARSARYRALHALARKHGCAAVACAHTADDRAETILLQLARGTGLRGLASPQPACVVDGMLRVRPALNERRSALHAAARGFPVVQDLTNRELRAARARLRAILLPALQTLWGEDPVPLLCALADEAACMRKTLERRAELQRPQADRRTLLREPRPTFAYLVEALRRAAGRCGPPLTARAYSALREFLAAGRRGRRYRSPGGEWWWVRRGDRLEITPLVR